MSIQLNVKMAGQTKEEYIRSVIETSKQIFNAEIGCEFFKDCNLKVAFCNSNNQVSVYEDLCGQFFPLYLAECYSRVNFFKAQALTNADKGIYGILVCLDTDEEPDEWYQIILHEMSHIFCIVHEHGGENFTDKYSESKLNNRDQYIMVSHGYAIWREFIADYMAYRISPLERPLSLTELRNIVRRLDDGVLDKRNPDWRQEVSQILANIFWTSKIMAAQDIEIVFALLEKNRIFHSKERCGDYREMIGLIFQQLEREPVWEISFDFIKKLGCAEIWVRFDMKPYGNV